MQRIAALGDRLFVFSLFIFLILFIPSTSSSWRGLSCSLYLSLSSFFFSYFKRARKDINSKKSLEKNSHHGSHPASHLARYFLSSFLSRELCLTMLTTTHPTSFTLSTLWHPQYAQNSQNFLIALLLKDNATFPASSPT